MNVVKYGVGTPCHVRKVYGCDHNRYADDIIADDMAYNLEYDDSPSHSTLPASLDIAQPPERKYKFPISSSFDNIEHHCSSSFAKEFENR